MQELRRGNWRTLSAARFPTDAASRTGAEWKYIGRAWIGRTLRVRVQLEAALSFMARLAPPTVVLLLRSRVTKLDHQVANLPEV